MRTRWSGGQTPAASKMPWPATQKAPHSTAALAVQEICHTCSVCSLCMARSRLTASHVSSQGRVNCLPFLQMWQDMSCCCLGSPAINFKGPEKRVHPGQNQSQTQQSTLTCLEPSAIACFWTWRSRPRHGRNSNIHQGKRLGPSLHWERSLWTWPGNASRRLAQLFSRGALAHQSKSRVRSQQPASSAAATTAWSMGALAGQPKASPQKVDFHSGLEALGAFDASGAALPGTNPD